jgi:hypothetical protein
MYSKKLNVLHVRPNNSSEINYYFYSSLSSTLATYKTAITEALRSIQP